MDILNKLNSKSKTTAEPRARVMATSNRFKPHPPPQVIYYWPFQGGVSVVVYSSFNFLLPVCLRRFVDFVHDHLVDICWKRTDLLAFHLCCFTLFRLDLFVFPFRKDCCLGKEVEFDYIGSWSLSLHLL